MFFLTSSWFCPWIMFFFVLFSNSLSSYEGSYIVKSWISHNLQKCHSNEKCKKVAGQGNAYATLPQNRKAT